jgi:hypothetical protein
VEEDAGETQCFPIDLVLVLKACLTANLRDWRLWQ